MRLLCYLWSSKKKLPCPLKVFFRKIEDCWIISSQIPILFYQLLPPRNSFILSLLELEYKLSFICNNDLKEFCSLLLNYISTGNHSSMEGLTYVIAMFVCAELRSFLLNYYFYLMMRVGSKIQTTLITAIYRKVYLTQNYSCTYSI